jgi:hypothetical protein
VSDHLPIINDRPSAVPLYFQFVQQLEAAITEGRLEKGLTPSLAHRNVLGQPYACLRSVELTDVRI